jgi:mannose-1-phosphate guanylyltransferase
MEIPSTRTWSLILAGGDGTRLRPLTTQIAGDARPKQFCRMFDGETLLDRTRRRADLVSRFDRQVIVVTRTHEPYYRRLSTDISPGRLVVQPENRGTAVGILYPLLRIGELAGDVPVAVFPSDHYVGDELAFASYVHTAIEVVEQKRELVVLLGIEADRPEAEYGWIEPDSVPLPIDGEPVFAIRRFWEKPSARVAELLLERGCLWNSFVMVGRLSAFLDLVDRAAPELLRSFARARSVLGTSAEPAAIERVYASLPNTGFSERVLVHASHGLATLRVKGVDWSDWGNPARVFASLTHSSGRPSWMRSIRLAG